MTDLAKPIRALPVHPLGSKRMCEVVATDPSLPAVYVLQD